MYLPKDQNNLYCRTAITIGTNMYNLFTMTFLHFFGWARTPCPPAEQRIYISDDKKIPHTGDIESLN